MDGDKLEPRVRQLEELIRTVEGVSEQKKQEMLELVHQVSLHDPLTELPNRTLFARRFNEEAHRAARHGQPLAVLALDLDYLKRYNDMYGHLQGDRALIHVAYLLTRQRRPEDIVARIGGEEFDVVLPETDERGAVTVAEDILRRFRSHPINDYVGLPERAEATYFKKRTFRDLTMSIGVATCTPKTNSDALLLPADADKALYSAKEAGRDRYVVYRSR
ncbi:GGDEF domain-containing protein [Candidatus Woesearchaeota archaeon]|nr:GGDEF domain-containing protein [Candidatus Woesearchaeota archaeon]